MQWDRLRNDLLVGLRLLGRWLCLLRLFAAGALTRLGVSGAGVRFPLAYPSMAKNRLDNLVAHLLGEHSTGSFSNEVMLSFTVAFFSTLSVAICGNTSFRLRKRKPSSLGCRACKH